MSRTLTINAADHAAHRALEHMVPVLDPPDGELPDAEELAAFAEGRLAERDAERLRSAIAASPAARVELRALYPQTYARLFEATPVEVGAEVIALRRPAIWVGGVAAAAALFLFVLRPLGPPEQASAHLDPVRSGNAVFRGASTAQRSATQTLRAGRTVDLHADLGQAGLLDRLGGAAPWGALIRLDGEGATVICTHTDAACRSSARTMASRQVISGSAGDVIRFGFIIANQPADLSAVPGPAADAEARLAAAASAAGGRLHWVSEVRVVD